MSVVNSLPTKGFNVVKAFGGRVIRFYGVGIATSTTECFVSFPIVNPDGLTYSCTVNYAAMTNVGNVTGAWDSSRSTTDCVVFKLTSPSNITQYRSYFCDVRFTLTF